MPGRQRSSISLILATVALCGAALSTGCGTTSGVSAAKGSDPYPNMVWPPPPDKPRIKLVDVIRGRADVEAESKFQKVLLGAGPQERYDFLRQPSGITFDGEGRILVSDPASAAIYRFDRKNSRLDILGTSGTEPLKTPLGLTVGPDQSIFVADAGLKKVIRYDSSGKILGAYGKPDELVNPTDVAASPDRKRLYVADSKGHKVAVFDIQSGALVNTIGRRGTGDGEWNFPSALAFGPDGTLYVVDQINSRIQLLSESGEFLDSFGGPGVAFGKFVRPKDVAIDQQGLIYVTDAALNNFQVFDQEFQMLTFVGTGGQDPGAFQNPSGIALYGDELAVCDQLNRRIQIFKFIGGRTAD